MTAAGSRPGRLRQPAISTPGWRGWENGAVRASGPASPPPAPEPTAVGAAPLDVLLVDDVPAIRVLLRQLLADDGRFRVVGEAADGNQAVAEAARLHPQLIVLDVMMPGGGGLAALPELRRVAPHARVVVLSGADSPDVEDQARALGAVGFLDKTLPPDSLVAGLLAMAGALDAVDAAVTEARSRLAAEVRSAGSARRFVERTLEGWDCLPPLDVVKLLVSELVTNAVVHARSEPEVVARLTCTAVHIEVLDASPEPPVVRRAGPYDTSGRGMELVDTFAAAWGVRRLPGGRGKAVWFEVPLLSGAADGDGAPAGASDPTGPPPAPSG